MIKKNLFLKLQEEMKVSGKEEKFCFLFCWWVDGVVFWWECGRSSFILTIVFSVAGASFAFFVYFKGFYRRGIVLNLFPAIVLSL